MIYTVTFNPSLDYIVSVPNFELGKTNRTVYEQMLAGGKGINVTTVLRNLGIDSTALGFVAGFTGDELIRRMNEMGLKNDFIRIGNGFSRINLKLKDVDGTEINGMGPVIDQAGQDALMRETRLYLQAAFPRACPEPSIPTFSRRFRAAESVLSLMRQRIFCSMSCSITPS